MVASSDDDDSEIHFRHGGAHGNQSFINSRSELFRSRLIEDFRLLDTIGEEGQLEVPRYYSKDFNDPRFVQKMMVDSPTGLVRFQVYSSEDACSSLMDKADPRLARLKNKVAEYPPLNLWANWVVESDWFQNTMLLLIVINSIVLGFQSEWNVDPNPDLVMPRTILDIIDQATLYIFCIEIILKWIDGFVVYWKSGWNVFDALITAISIVPELIMQFDPATSDDSQKQNSDLSQVASALRIFRILRALKLVTRFQKVRIIVLAVTKAFKEMVFITTLLALCGYIFAVVGKMFFDKYAESHKRDLKYKTGFSSVWQVLATLFQLFTLDQWFKILEDVQKVSDKLFTFIFFMLWICLGSFIFHNIFIGIMVNNFQTIRNELFEEMQMMKQKQQQQERLMFLNEEMQQEDAEATREEKRMQQKRMEIDERPSESTTGGGFEEAGVSGSDDARPFFRRGMQTEEELIQAIGLQLDNTAQKSREWQQALSENLDTLARSHTGSETIWPRDTLFRYLILMENLMENLEERKKLIDLTAKALLKMHEV